MRYAITGATGFVGGALARQLRHAATRCGPWSATPRSATALSALGVEIVEGDLDDTAALDRLCTDVDGLFHVAGWYKVGQHDSSPGTRVNVEGTRHVLAAAQRKHAPGRLHEHAGGELRHPRRGVRRDAPAHRRLRQPLRPHQGRGAPDRQGLPTEGLPVVIVQPGLVYGPGDTAQTGDLVAQVVRGKRPQVPRGGGVCWAHVDDVAAGHVLAMDKGRPGESYMLAGQRATLAEGLQRIATIAGTKGPVVLPDALVRATGRVTGAVGRVLPVPPLFAEETLLASLATYYGSPEKAERELGWHPRDLDTGLQQTVGALRG